MKHPACTLDTLQNLMGTLGTIYLLSLGTPQVSHLILETLNNPPYHMAARGDGQDWKRRPGLPAASVGRGRRPAARRREVSRLTADQLVGY